MTAKGGSITTLFIKDIPEGFLKKVLKQSGFDDNQDDYDRYFPIDTQIDLYVCYKDKIEIVMHSGNVV